ncbi:helix-turn-helix domain-containing protein [Chryseobacterium scophthalmum]|uniref:AraC-type DNA-binding protein n=1 Tax=Chryseobacterium scophthalmum TaxID=59733 RepID=A0A1N6IZD5_9FLAO|nr:AraC family transcriptional regulator [Chryseobacterium scophthalmum]SIO37430.1 AraC-type DNA-binding protein [Chryseobacterium scophthalmum]
MMNYIKYPPPKELENFVQYFWSYDFNRPDISIIKLESFADRFPRLIYQDINNFQSIFYEKGRDMPKCYISGVVSEKLSAFTTGTYSHFGVSFYPHGLFAFFPINSFELIDKEYDISDFDKTNIGNILDNCISHQDKVSKMSQYLIEKLRHNKSNLSLMNQIIHSNVIDYEKKIHELQKENNISERHLERIFKTMIGISPKKYQRIIRFEKALTLLNGLQYSELTALAYELHYSDQSHFIKDFKQFSGITPYEFVQSNIIGSESSSFITLIE